MDNILEFLLEKGGCSIRYRIKREILHEDKTSSEMAALQDEIMNRPKVRKILAAQHDDGWIGKELHGGPVQGLDSSVAYLLSRGVERDSVPMKKVVQALLADKKEEKPYRTTFPGGEAMDAGGRGGNKAVIAGVLADLGEENNQFVQDELKTAITYLKDSLSYNTIDDFSATNKKGVRYYKEDAHFPGSNHLNLLSAAQCWRTPENIELVKTSLCHCMKIMKNYNHNIMFKTSTHFVGPFNFNWSLYNFSIEDINQDSYELVWWLRSLYKLSTLGLVREKPEFRNAYDYLYQLVISEDILKKQNDKSLKRFKDILSIEDGWRNEASIFCDIIFYGIIILYNAGYNIFSFNEYDCCAKR